MNNIYCSTQIPNSTLCFMRMEFIYISVKLYTILEIQMSSLI
jgi:hypothetical protein